MRITLTDEGRELRKQAENIPEQVFCALGQPVDELQDLRARLLYIRGNLVNTLSR